jgi:hypothetical protein
MDHTNRKTRSYCKPKNSRKGQHNNKGSKTIRKRKPPEKNA